MIWPITSPLFQKQNVSVISRGEYVVLQIGNTPIEFHYEHALDLSKWVREESRSIAKHYGDSKSLRSLGTLNPEPSPPVPANAGIHIKPKLLRWHRQDVTSKGRILTIKIGAHGFDIHYKVGLIIAQWLRVRAKEARNLAGDTRHWSEIGADD